ncbi:MAG: DUF2018 family protein [Wolinella sp.]
MDYDIFEGTPEEKWLDVLFNASQTLARAELLYLLERLALFELASDEIPDFCEKLKDIDIKSKLKMRSGSLAIESMGRILSQNE